MLAAAPTKAFHYYTRPRQAQLRRQVYLTYQIGVFPIDCEVCIIRHVPETWQGLQKRHELWMPEPTHTSAPEALRGVGQGSESESGQRPPSSAAQSGSRHKIRASSVGRR